MDIKEVESGETKVLLNMTKWKGGDGGVPCGFAGGKGVKDFVEETEMGAPVPAGHS